MSSLITLPSPDFTAKAVMPDGSINDSFNLHSYLKGKNGILFFYPLDFSFVCPSEILSFNNKIEQFESENASLIGVSVDSHFSHFAWREAAIDNGGIGQIKFPLVSDLSKTISRKYDVLLNDEVSLRGVFIIDTKGIIRSATINDLPIGRDANEVLRTLQAINYVEKNDGKEVCPAGWKPGQPAMKPTKTGVAEFLGENHSKL